MGYVHVQDVSDEYVREYAKIGSESMWQKAELFAKWKRDTKLGDADIAAACADGVKGSWVSRLRRAWEDFGADRHKYPDLGCSHFTAAVAWDDAEKHLKIAQRDKLTCAEMLNLRTKETAAELTSTSTDTENTGIVEDSAEQSASVADMEPEEAEESEQIPPDASPSLTIQAQPDPKADIECDAIGTKIPGSLLPVFRKSQPLTKLEDALDEFADKVRLESERITEDVNPQYHNRLEAILGQIANAAREIRFCVPYAVCGFCKGRGRDCQQCRTKGWIEKDTWEFLKDRKGK